MYYKGKWCTAGGKDPLFGHVDGFQIDPNFNAEKVSKVIFAAAISAFCPNEKLTFSAENAMIQKRRDRST